MRWTGLGRPAEIRPADVCAGPAGRKILSLAKKIFFSENLLRILTFLRTPSLRLMRPTSFLPTVGLDGSEGSDCRIFLFLNPLVLNPSDGEWKYILHRSGISTRVRMDLRDVWRKNQAASAA